jgi:hypothetical protein
MVSPSTSTAAGLKTELTSPGQALASRIGLASYLVNNSMRTYSPLTTRAVGTGH